MQKKIIADSAYKCVYISIYFIVGYVLYCRCMEEVFCFKLPAEAPREPRFISCLLLCINFKMTKLNDIIRHAAKQYAFEYEAAIYIYYMLLLEQVFLLFPLISNCRVVNICGFSLSCDTQRQSLLSNVPPKHMVLALLTSSTPGIRRPCRAGDESLLSVQASKKQQTHSGGALLQLASLSSDVIRYAR